MSIPHCTKKEHTITQHGQTRVDNYAWLRDKNWKDIVDGELNFSEPEVLKYIEAENAYKDSVMSKNKEVEKKVYAELLSRIKEDKEGYPSRDNMYYYFEREVKGLNYPILCRFKHSENFSSLPVDYDFTKEKKDAEVYFDINKEAEGEDLYSFRGNDTNKENTLFAYMYNLTGSLECTLKVRDLKTGKDLDWQIENSTGSFIWINNHELYYIERDDQSRGKKIFKIDVNKGPSSKQLVFTKPEEFDSTYMGIGETTDEKHVMLTLTSGSTQVTYISEKGSDTFDMFIIGKDDLTYSLDHWNGDFYILTNDGAEDFKIVKTSADKSSWGKDNWKPYIAEEKGKCLTELHVYNDYLVVERKNNETGLPEIGVTGLKSDPELKIVKMPEAAYSLSFWGGLGLHGN
ncbi:hypothetical protein N9W79_02080 [bacterium]|nr:hypothetical protein [bacterium]